MKRLSATEAARRFSDVLDAVETRRESFVVLRRGRAVATIGPATGATGVRIKEVLRQHPPDSAWAGDLHAVRTALADDTDPWRG
jgi:antitoxin (DNA-binding transcriptional repressor) of toxin-antitoxin stability system